MLLAHGCVHVWMGSGYLAGLAQGDTAYAAAVRVVTAAANGGVPVPLGVTLRVEPQGGESNEFWASFRGA